MKPDSIKEILDLCQDKDVALLETNGDWLKIIFNPSGSTGTVEQLPPTTGEPPLSAEDETYNRLFGGDPPKFNGE